MKKLLLSCLIVGILLSRSVADVAGIDSGGGGSEIGSFTNYGSIGEPVSTVLAPAEVGGNHPGLIAILFPPDSDGDGLPDDWEYESFGTLDLDGFDNPDGDLSDNLLEYLAGTDPNDPTSVFIPTLTSGEAGLELGFDTILSRSYTISISGDLESWEEWQTVEGDGSTKTFIIDDSTMPEGSDLTRYFFQITITEIASAP